MLRGGGGGANISRTSPKRVAVFLQDIGPYEAQAIQIKLAGGREINAPLNDVFSPGRLLFIPIPSEVKEVPIDAFVFKQPTRFTRIIFTIPSLIEVFPENKGVVNRFDMRTPGGKVESWSTSYVEEFLENGLGMSIDPRKLSKQWRSETLRIDLAGKTFREILLEYLAFVDVSPDDIFIDLKRNEIRLKTPLPERLKTWWQAPTPERWPWQEP